MELNLYALMIDLILIAVFAVTVRHGWKRGFIGAVSGILSLIGAWILSGMFSFLLVGVLQRNIYDPFVFDVIGTLIENAVRTAGATADAAAQAISASLEGLRSCTEIFGIVVPLDAASLSELLTTGVADTVTDSLTAEIAVPIAARLSEWTAHLMVFILAYVLLRIVFGMLDIVMKLPILKEANSLLGGVGGIILGAGYAFVASRLLAVILGILVTQGTLPPEIMSGVIFGFLTGSPTVSI